LGHFHGKIVSDGNAGRGPGLLISLHKQATTTPRIRLEIQSSTQPKQQQLEEKYRTARKSAIRARCWAALPPIKWN
jgi:hypothetical protein